MYIFGFWRARKLLKSAGVELCWAQEMPFSSSVLERYLSSMELLITVRMVNSLDNVPACCPVRS